MSRAAPVFLAGLLALSAAAAPPAAGGPLESYLAGLQSLDADFEQFIRSPTGALVERLTGRMALLRPGRFRWEIDTPYHQLIVVDGEHLWLYDPELEQVSVRPAVEALAHTPAALLTGTAQLEAYFRVSSPRPAPNGGIEVELVPRAGRSDDYHGLKLYFTHGELSGLDFTDGLDQEVQVRFSEVRRNQPGNPVEAEFRFTPPQGVDVVDLSSAGSPAVP